jgi:SAM-dependent methyltransferase
MSAQDETSPLADGSGPPQSGDQDTENIEADALEILENDSAFGDDLSAASSRTSLTSGITKYREENGRRYHAYRDGKYLMPNDDAEQDRLDLHHHIFNLVTGGKLFHAPIQHPSRVLDAGTGTGIWAIDFADLYPGAHVIGCDLSPIQPGWIPPNLEFEVDDIEDTWRHKPFSYIHIRGLSGAIKDWKLLLTQAYDHLDPGGYLEIIDFETWIYEQDGDGSRIPMIQKWQEGLNEAGEKFGRSFNTAARLKNWIEEVGFVNVEEIITKVLYVFILVVVLD